MKKLAILSIIIICVLTLSSCSNQHHANVKEFEKQLDEAEAKKKSVKTVMDKIHLKQLDQLSKTDTTDKNKKEFKALQKDVNHHLMPAFEAYEKEAKKLPADNQDVKDLKTKYLDNVKQERQSINELKSFIDLCNQSIKANEGILDYTKLFERNRSQVESKIQKASNQNDANQLTSKIENNNKKLKETAQKYLENEHADSKKAINQRIKPLIERQITDLNQTNITDSNVNAARKNAIEMYYNLLNYYDTRETTVNIEKQLSKIDVDKLPKTGKELSEHDNDFYNSFKKLKK
ncbi:EMYY motif lipoprotein [Staphylococcus devriesei]|uniref:EMYY motif lipoprotein n=1 Tax=Staphylococcus devriesei TaxID=586733 RepID=UPI000D1CAB1E|nr:EMYY motif lipoprotein [Staphylococcus devriesei]PTF18976.1 EMYY motif lipoprotein [Staphylococcus devriesei]